MMPSKVISIAEARRRLPGKVKASVKAKAKVRKPQAPVWSRLNAWLSSRTTNGMVLLVGVLVGLVLGTLVASARPEPTEQPDMAAVEQPSSDGPVEYTMP